MDHQQTKLEQERYTLCAAYQLVRDDLRKLVGRGDTRLSVAVSLLDSRLEALVRAPGE
jgi:hypothetical protein